MRCDPIWDMLGARLPRGVLGLSDPDVHCIDDRWTMFVGGFSTGFRNRLYRARLPVSAALGSAGWQLDRVALTADPPRGAWDAGGMHAPSYVPPRGGRPALLYYAGRATRRHYGPGSAYAIGVLTQSGRGWQRREAPVLRGWPDRASVLEPLVVAVYGGYRMWFLATPHEVGPGEQPDFELWVADSPDGYRFDVAGRFATRAEGFFDNAVYPAGDGWEMLLARGTNLHGTSPYPEQGLWLMRAESPAADRAAWSSPVRVLDTDAAGTPGWLGSGACGPSVVCDGDRRLVFLTGTRRTRSWPRAAAHRLAAARRLPVPAPYFLATGLVAYPACGAASRN